MENFILTFISFYEMLLRVGQQDEERNEPVFIPCSGLVKFLFPSLERKLCGVLQGVVVRIIAI